MAGDVCQGSSWYSCAWMVLPQCSMKKDPAVGTLSPWVTVLCTAPTPIAGLALPPRLHVGAAAGTDLGPEE